MAINQHIKSRKHVETAIDYTPIEATLGMKVAKDYVIRELIDSDNGYLEGKMATWAHTLKSRTNHLMVAVAHQDNPRAPLCFLLASKYRSSTKTLTIHGMQTDLSGISTKLKMQLTQLLLLTAQLYAYLVGADTIRTTDVGDKALQKLLTASGFEMKLSKGCLYGVRKAIPTNSPTLYH